MGAEYRGSTGAVELLRAKQVLHQLTEAPFSNVKCNFGREGCDAGVNVLGLCVLRRKRMTTGSVATVPKFQMKTLHAIVVKSILWKVTMPFKSDF